MLFLAAVSAADKIQDIPPATWLKIGIGVAAVIVAVILLRKVAKMNKVVLGVIVFVVCTIVFFNWVYYRKEPRFMTPVINKIAPFFPSAGTIEERKWKDPGK